jgi:hypothetical protein
VPQIEIILGLLLAVAALVTLARRLALPYPVLLVLGRQAVVTLRDDGVISDEVLRRIQRDLDLEEVQLG